jgi:hypothetical protein
MYNTHNIYLSNTIVIVGTENESPWARSYDSCLSNNLYISVITLFLYPFVVIKHRPFFFSWRITGMILFSVIWLISDIFVWKLFSESCWTRQKKVKNDHFERGVSANFHRFHWFYFLTRTISSIIRFVPKKHNGCYYLWATAYHSAVPESCCSIFSFLYHLLWTNVFFLFLVTIVLPITSITDSDYLF